MGNAGSRSRDRGDAVEPPKLVRVADGVDVSDPTILDDEAHCRGEFAADVDPGGG